MDSTFQTTVKPHFYAHQLFDSHKADMVGVFRRHFGVDSDFEVKFHRRMQLGSRGRMDTDRGATYTARMLTDLFEEREVANDDDKLQMLTELVHLSSAHSVKSNKPSKGAAAAMYEERLLQFLEAENIVLQKEQKGRLHALWREDTSVGGKHEPEAVFADIVDQAFNVPSNDPDRASVAKD